MMKKVNYLEKLLSIAEKTKEKTNSGGELSIEINPHRSSLYTIEEYINSECMNNKYWPSKDAEECILKDSLVVIIFYPLCASGFYECVKPTVEEAAKEMVEKSESA